MDISGKHIVVDLETLSTHSNACIVSIGACLVENLEITDTFYINVNGVEGRQAGLHVEPETIKWWEEQSKEARDLLKESRGWKKILIPRKRAEMVIF